MVSYGTRRAAARDVNLRAWGWCLVGLAGAACGSRSGIFGIDGTTAAGGAASGGSTSAGGSGGSGGSGNVGGWLDAAIDAPPPLPDCV